MPDLRHYDLRHAEDMRHLSAVCRVVGRLAGGWAVGGVLDYPGLGMCVAGGWLLGRWLVDEVAHVREIGREVRDSWRAHEARIASGELDPARADAVPKPEPAEEAG